MDGGFYYASDASGRSEIWKIRVDDGKATQITTDGGFEPREAPDGRSLFYVDAPHQNGLGRGAKLKRVSVDGGPTSVALSGVPPGAWDVTDTGIVFRIGCTRSVAGFTGGRYRPVLQLRRRSRSADRHAPLHGRALRRLPLVVGLARWPLGARQPHRQLAARHRRCRSTSVDSNPPCKSGSKPP